jgi:hypothetical protein
MILRCADRPYRAWTDESKVTFGARVSLAPNSGVRAGILGPPLWADSVEKVENTAKTKFSQKLAGRRFLLRMRSSCEEEGRRKLLFKSTWSTVSDRVKRISGS